MGLDLLKEKGIPLDRQVFDWRDLVGAPISKLDDDAFTRMRVILMSAIEAEAVRFSHACARSNKELQLSLARVRRIEQHQWTLLNGLLPADQSPIETTIGYEQMVIELSASLAAQEPDPYVAQVLRFGMLEDFDHLYRYAALMDRLCGKDANTMLQSYTDIRPGRPTKSSHRAPEDDLRESYDRKTAAPITKLNSLTILAAEQYTHDYYMRVGASFADPLARQLFAEIASVEEQHVTQYESMIDPYETWVEKWLLHEATEVYNYYSCHVQEENREVKAIWERLLNYELGQLHFVMQRFQIIDKRDPFEVIPQTLPDPTPHVSQRELLRAALKEEVDLRAAGTQFLHKSEEQDDFPSVQYRNQLNSKGSPSETVAAGYVWRPGTELAERARSQPLLETELAEETLQ